MLPIEFAEKLPSGGVLWRVAGSFELRSGPEDGSLRTTAESLRVEQGGLIMITEDAQVHTHDAVDTFARIGSVADNIAEAVDHRDIL